jgi:dCMP deaminase
MLKNIIQLVSLNQSAERIHWDDYFMSIAFLASMRSPCERLHVGSVIVKNNRIISMGYNGFIAGSPHISRVRDGSEQAIIHSEVNAIVDCARRGVSLDGAKIYITHYPCINCFRSVAGSGIREIIYREDYRNDPLVMEIAREANIEIRKLEI